MRRFAELSLGQWRKLAFARDFMLETPLLLVPDEPPAGLDTESGPGLRRPGRPASP